VGRSSQLAESATIGLKQLEAEEGSILSYVKCPDIDHALAKIRNYRNLTTKAREMEIELRALLDGRKPENWEEQEIELSRSLSSARRDLEENFPNYEPTTREVESWRSECATLQNSVPSAIARLNKLEGSLESEKKGIRDLASLEGEIDYMHLRKNELDFLYKAYNEAINTLESVVETVSEEYIPALSEKAGNYLGRVTSGRYDHITINPDWEIAVDSKNKAGLNPQMLSVGAADQLYMSLRIACGELLSAGKNLPVLLDDPFASFDQGRLKNALDLLGMLAGGMQILLFSHDPIILAWAESVCGSGDIQCAVHVLNNS
jgi:uncharacterized protein YhaN